MTSFERNERPSDFLIARQSCGRAGRARFGVENPVTRFLSGSSAESVGGFLRHGSGVRGRGGPIPLRPKQKTGVGDPHGPSSPIRQVGIQNRQPMRQAQSAEISRETDFQSLRLTNRTHEFC